MKIHATPFLMTVATIGAMFIMSATMDNASFAAYQTTPASSGSLGTLRSSEIQNLNAQPDDGYKDVGFWRPGLSDTTLQPVQVGEASYITGGIGDEERYALQEVAPNYNVRIMSALKSGHFSGTTRVVIRDRDGNEVINAESGPLFFAHLPAGRYTIEASSEGETKSKNITVGSSKAATLNFSW